MEKGMLNFGNNFLIFSPLSTGAKQRAVADKKLINVD